MSLVPLPFLGLSGTDLPLEVRISPATPTSDLTAVSGEGERGPGWGIILTGCIAPQTSLPHSLTLSLSGNEVGAMCLLLHTHTHTHTYAAAVCAEGTREFAVTGHRGSTDPVPPVGRLGPTQHFHLYPKSEGTPPPAAWGRHRCAVGLRPGEGPGPGPIWIQVGSPRCPGPLRRPRCPTAAAPLPQPQAMPREPRVP